MQHHNLQHQIDSSHMHILHTLKDHQLQLHLHTYEKCLRMYHLLHKQNSHSHSILVVHMYILVLGILHTHQVHHSMLHKSHHQLLRMNHSLVHLDQYIHPLMEFHLK